MDAEESEGRARFDWKLKAGFLVLLELDKENGLEEPLFWFPEAPGGAILYKTVKGRVFCNRIKLKISLIWELPVGGGKKKKWRR